MVKKLTAEDVEALREALKAGVISSDRIRHRVFVITGTLSMRRADMELLIATAGGRVERKVTSWTSYLIVGGGAAADHDTVKIQDAEALGVKRITEEIFVQMLLTSEE